MISDPEPRRLTTTKEGFVWESITHGYSEQNIVPFRNVLGRLSSTSGYDNRISRGLEPRKNSRRDIKTD